MEEPTSPRPGRAHTRWLAAALRARWNAHLALRRERAAVERLGAALAREEYDVAVDRDAVRTALDELRRRDGEIGALRAAVAASLDEDRRDYGDASSWLRPLVILRGMATRCLRRDRLRRARKERREACRAVGRAALDEEVAPGSAATVVVEAREARAVRIDAVAAAEAHLATIQASPVGTVARYATREALAVGTPLVHQLRGRLFPRVPALAGLAVGWWIASTFTDSGFTATLHALGIGSGPRRVVSREQLRAMEFWLPMVAAAVCSYAGGRIAALVRARYAPASDADPHPRA